jgi:oligoendopeptidase F
VASDRRRSVVLAWLSASAIGLFCLLDGSLVGEARADLAQVPEMTPSPTWDLDTEYPTPEAWDRSFADLRTRVGKFESHRGDSITHASQLADLLDESAYLRGQAGRMARYALLKAALDTTSTPAKARFDSASGLEATVESGVSWLDAAVADLGPSTIRAWQRSEPRLHMHAWLLAKIRSRASNRYPPGGAVAYAALERQASTASLVYDDVMQSDVGWASARQDSGHSVRLDPATFATLSTSHNAVVRRKAVEAYYRHLKALERPLGDLLTRRYEIDHVLAQAQHYANGIDAAFAVGDGLPPGTYKTMIRSVHENSKTLERFIAVTARVNHIGAIRYDDLQVSAPEFSHGFTLRALEEIAVASSAALGEAYQEELRQIWEKPWFDFAPRPHKDDGAVGLYWQVGGGHPYGLLTSAGGLGNSRTVAAMGALAMFYSRIPPGKLPQRREEDFPIYGNAVWFMATMLQSDYLLRKTDDPKERIALLAGDLRRCWRNFVSNALATDFEERMEGAIAAGHPPVGSEISQLYLSVLHDYYGEAAIRIPAFDAEEWMTLSNIFYGHVQDEWAFAMAAAAAMAENVAKRDPATIAALTSPMGRPESFLSVDLLRDAQADPTKLEMYAAIFRRMNTDIDMLDAALAPSSSPTK